MPLQDPKGKSIAEEQREVSSLVVLFGLLGSTLCERSNSHLLLVLALLEIILTAAREKASKPAQLPTAPRDLPAVPENEESGQPAAATPPAPQLAAADARPQGEPLSIDLLAPWQRYNLQYHLYAISP